MAWSAAWIMIRFSAVFLERNLAVVLPQKVQEPLVVARLHVEEPGDDSVVSTGFLETSADDLSHVAPCDFAIHEERIHRRPERFVLLAHPLVEVVGYRAPPLALGAQRNRSVLPDFRGQVLHGNGLSVARHDESFDD